MLSSFSVRYFTSETCSELSELPNSEISEEHLDCKSKISTSNMVMVDSTLSFGLSSIAFEVGVLGVKLTLAKLLRLLSFSGVRTLSMLPLPASKSRYDKHENEEVRKRR